MNNKELKLQILEKVGYDLDKAKEIWKFLNEEEESPLKGKGITCPDNCCDPNFYIELHQQDKIVCENTDDGFFIAPTKKIEENDIQNEDELRFFAVCDGSHNIDEDVYIELTGDDKLSKYEHAHGLGIYYPKTGYGIVIARTDYSPNPIYLTDKPFSQEDISELKYKFDARHNTNIIKEYVAYNHFKIYVLGYWLIPTVQQLEFLYNNLHQINERLSELEKIGKERYWSSSLDKDGLVGVFSFNDEDSRITYLKPNFVKNNMRLVSEFDATKIN